MTTRRATRKLFAWFALCAIVMASLAPTLSHALGRTASANWVEICTTQGSKWLALSTADAGDASETPGDAPAPALHPFEHCDYCSHHLQPLGLPPAALSVDPAPTLHEGPPAAFYSAPRTLHAWVRAQPRAPPILG